MARSRGTDPISPAEQRRVAELQREADAPVEIRIYTVTYAHPDYEGTGEADLIATSERAAIARIRGTMFHHYQDARWYDGNAVFTVTGSRPHVPGWNAQNAS